MTDRPILFSGPMVRALLDGRKTQTRRVLNPQPEADFVRATIEAQRLSFTPAFLVGGPTHKMLSLLARPGDRLWVREAWRAWWEYNETPPKLIPTGAAVQYVADDPLSPWDTRYRPSMFMPRWASRLTLIVEDVRVERLQDIREEDAEAEGIEEVAAWKGIRRFKVYGKGGENLACPYGARISLSTLWDTINGPGAWDMNPWVAAYTFRVIKQNIDQMEPPHD